VNIVFLYYTQGGFLIVRPEDDLRYIVDAILGTGYNEEFCVSADFSADFIARLMGAGFLVMSSRLEEPEDTPVPADAAEIFILLPKLHLSRSVLFFDDLHIKKSVKRYLDRYELRFDTDFDQILDRCIAVHGDHWLTPPLVSAIRSIRKDRLHGVYPASFALYRNGKLVAGDIGNIAGKVYTSYSGYHDESNSGTVQLILICRYLKEHGFAFFDLGMPMDYKTSLGATDISPKEFVTLFRAAQENN
jgi:Leu/Phe-tRNA-protein transferase